jgi:hypothetical protein
MSIGQRAIDPVAGQSPIPGQLSTGWGSACRRRNAPGSWRCDRRWPRSATTPENLLHAGRALPPGAFWQVIARLILPGASQRAGTAVRLAPVRTPVMCS